jgi:uncharacterized OB-fold protein
VTVAPAPPERAAQSPLAQYRAHLQAGRLAYQWSPAAGRAVFFPRLVCPFTGSTELEWRIASGLGVVYATTVVFPRGGPPHNVALVDCDEGFRLMTRVIDVEPEAVQIGQRVRLVVAALEEGGEPLPLFRPAEAP